MSQLSHDVPPYLVLDALVKRYRETCAVDRVSLTIQEGEAFSLLGPSGCGKTTLLRMIAGFCQPSSGDIRLQGLSMLPLPPHRRAIGLMFQHYALFPHMTVAANIAFGLRMQRHPPKVIRQRVDELLTLVRMEELGDRFPHQLSGGQQQRVALARALAITPRVLLLDEPLSALDKQLREDMQIELRRIQRQLGITMVFVTHDQEEALMLADRIGVMHQGRLEQVGSCREIYEQPATPFVAQFIGKVNSFACRRIDQPHPQFILSNGTCLPGTTCTQLMDGERQLVVRPEHVRIVPNPTEQSSVLLVGRVQSVVFVGMAVHVYVEIPDCCLVTVYLTSAEARHLEPQLCIGAAVGVCWEAQHALVF